MQIRRYLYRGLLHRDIVDYLKGRKKALHFKGVMSFYPLLSDLNQLRALDGWLVSTVARAVQTRSRRLLSHGFDRQHFFPLQSAIASRAEPSGMASFITSLATLALTPSVMVSKRAMAIRCS